MKKNLLKLSTIALLGLSLIISPLSTFAEEQTIGESEPGDVITTEAGDFNIVNVDNEIDEVIEHGPFTIKVNYISTVHVDATDMLKPFINDQDEVNLIAFDFTIENTSDEDYSISPELSSLVVNKQQLNGHLLLSSNIGGDYFGNVIKEGTINFIYDGDLEDVKDMKLVMPSGFDSEYTSIGDDIEIEFSFDDGEDESDE